MRSAFAAAALLLSTAPLLPQAARAEATLAFNPANIARVKAMIATDTQARGRWQALRAIADKALTASPKGERDIDAALEALALSYQVTHETKYAQGARALLLKRAAKTDWLTDTPLARRDPPWHSDLGMGFAAASTGIAYDAVRDTLSPQDRQTIAQGLIRGAILPILEDWVDGRTRIHTLDTMGHNWWAHIVFGAGVAALAVRNDDPRALSWANRIDAAGAEWFEFPGTRIGTKPPTFSDGAYSETVSYADLALHSLLLFRRSWTEALGTAPTPIPDLAKVPGYFLAAAYPRKTGWVSLNFGDSRPPSCGCHTLADLWALGDHDPQYLKYIAGFAGVPAKDAWAEATNLPYLPDASARAAAISIEEPKTRVFTDEGLLTMRDAWHDDATLFALKSGFTWNHNHADAGSFILYHKGHALLADSGHSVYSSPEYDAYYRQSAAHNVVTIDGKAEPRSDLYDGSHFMGTIDHVLDTPDLKYAWADVTGPTTRYFQRNYRNVMWIGDTILILDDLRSAEAGQFEWLLHYQGTAKRNGRTVAIRDEDAGVDVTPLFPAALPDGGLPTDYPEAIRLVEHDGLADEDPKIKQTYLGFQPATKTDREKFLVALQPRDEGRSPSRLDRLEGLNWIGVRVSGPDRVTEVYFNLLADGQLRHRNANTTLGGFETDAYILALSWPTGKTGSRPDQITLVDGSYVRTRDNVVLDSLAKVTAHLTFGASTQIALASDYRRVSIACNSALHVGNSSNSLPCLDGQAVIQR